MEDSEIDTGGLSTWQVRIVEGAGRLQKEALKKRLDEGYRIEEVDVEGDIVVKKGLSYRGITRSGRDIVL